MTQDNTSAGLLADELAKAVHENGPIVVDFYGTDLAWRPLDYGTWTVFHQSAAPASEAGEVLRADAAEMGYLSLHEALAHLNELRSRPSESAETVGLLREARDYVAAEAEAATDDDGEGMARDLLARIDAALDAQQGTDDAEEPGGLRAHASACIAARDAVIAELREAGDLLAEEVESRRPRGEEYRILNEWRDALAKLDAEQEAHHD